jgi:hypothetical protein
MMAALTLPELLSWAREQAAEVLAGFAIHNPNYAVKEEQEEIRSCDYQGTSGLNSFLDGQPSSFHILSEAVKLFSHL